MVNNKIKETGATFTPKGLADFLASQIFNSLEKKNSLLKVLDPACGNGNLLSAMDDLLQSKNLPHSLYGYDTDINYINDAKVKLASNYAITVNLKFEDFLLDDSSINLDLFSTQEKRELVDIIIANPPYVRTQVLGAERSQLIAKKYNLKGKIDLYYPFLISMTNSLKAGGIMGVITSNRYLTTKSGGQIRKFLLDNYEVIKVIDLGDTKLFDAAVLPAIFIGRKRIGKKSAISNGTFSKIYETLNDNISNIIQTESVFEILNKNVPGIYGVAGKAFSYNTGLLKHSANHLDIWQMTDEAENEWIDIIKKNAAFFVGEKFKVRVGIKSCADKVFIKDWTKETVIPEDVFFRKLISQENIKRWKLSCKSSDVVLYPHYDDNGKRRVYDIEQYPKAKVFFENHKETLMTRKYLIEGGRKWYELWVPQNPALWKMPKLVFPDISLEPRFYYDNNGAIVNGNCYWIVAQNSEEENLLLLIQGVANSELMSKYHDLCFNNKLYSGRRRYLSQYIEKYPIPDPNSKASLKIISLVKKLNDDSIPEDDIIDLENRLNIAVKEAFGILD
ncbi:MAG: N-6 DNA methylase [Alistipes sp.]|nr:N-6 DNA methylase [Alistipes sp.]